MKDLQVFTTEHGVASLILKEIPYQGTAYISSLSIEDPVDDVVSISLELTGTGELSFHKGE